MFIGVYIEGLFFISLCSRIILYVPLTSGKHSGSDKQLFDFNFKKYDYNGGFFKKIILTTFVPKKYIVLSST